MVTASVDIPALKARHPLGDAVEAAGVRLHGRGRVRQGVCPFHDEAEGSFTTKHGIVDSEDVEKMYLMRLMALLQELVRGKGYKGAAQVLEIDPQTVTNSVKTGQLTRRVRDSLERALQEGIGSAADRQRARSDRLEARLDKLEGQVKELREQLTRGIKALNRLEVRLEKTAGKVKEMEGNRRTGLKGLRMSLNGVKNYYAWQRRLIDQRLLALEAARDGTETGAPAGDEREGPGAGSVAASDGFPAKLTDSTPGEPGASEELTRSAPDRDTAPRDSLARRNQRSRRALRSQVRSVSD